MSLKDLPVMTRNQNKHYAISHPSADTKQVEDYFVVQTLFLYNDS